MTSREDRIAPTGLWRVSNDEGGIPIPDHLMADPSLSLMAKGLLALLLAEQGRPVNPYEDALESDGDIAAAIEELIDAGLAVRIEQ